MRPARSCRPRCRGTPTRDGWDCSAQEVGDPWRVMMVCVPSPVSRRQEVGDPWAMQQEKAAIKRTAKVEAEGTAKVRHTYYGCSCKSTGKVAAKSISKVAAKGTAKVRTAKVQQVCGRKTKTFRAGPDCEKSSGASSHARSSAPRNLPTALATKTKYGKITASRVPYQIPI